MLHLCILRGDIDERIGPNYFDNFQPLFGIHFSSSKISGNESCYLRQFSVRLGTCGHFDISTNILGPWDSFASEKMSATGRVIYKK